MINFIRKHFMFVLVCGTLGTVLGSYLSTFSKHDADRIAFWWRPVVKMQGDLVAKTSAGEALIHIYGAKLRGEECVYKGLQAFGDRAAGPVVDLRIARVDLPEGSNTKPAGGYDIGAWRVWPVQGLIQVNVYVTHDCGTGRLWATKIAEVKL